MLFTWIFLLTILWMNLHMLYIPTSVPEFPLFSKFSAGKDSFKLWSFVTKSSTSPLWSRTETTKVKEKEKVAEKRLEAALRRVSQKDMRRSAREAHLNLATLKVTQNPHPSDWQTAGSLKKFKNAVSVTPRKETLIKLESFEMTRPPDIPPRPTPHDITHQSNWVSKSIVHQGKRRRKTRESSLSFGLFQMTKPPESVMRLKKKASKQMRYGLKSPSLRARRCYKLAFFNMKRHSNLLKTQQKIKRIRRGAPVIFGSFKVTIPPEKTNPPERTATKTVNFNTKGKKTSINTKTELIFRKENLDSHYKKALKQSDTKEFVTTSQISMMTSTQLVSKNNKNHPINTEKSSKKRFLSELTRKRLANAADYTKITSTVSERKKRSSTSYIWYISDEGSDQNDCQTESTPCKNLQTVLNRAADGADIHITSSTLLLSNCMVKSNISYTLSSGHGSYVHVTCPGGRIDWLVGDKKAGISHVHLQYLHFISPYKLVMIKLYGLVTVENCIVDGYTLVIIIHRSKHESKPTIDTLLDFHSSSSKQSINLIRTKTKSVAISAADVARKILIEETYLGGHLDNEIGHYECGNTCDITIVSLVLSNCSVTDNIQTESDSENSYLLIQVKNTILGLMKHSGTNSAYQIHKTVFNENFLLDGANFLNITETTFHGKQSFCTGGCAIDVSGVFTYPVWWNLNMRTFFLIPYDLFQPTFGFGLAQVLIHDSLFIGNHTKTYGGAISTKDTNLHLNRCQFILAESHIPPHVNEGLIHFKHGDVNASNVLFDASESDTHTGTSLTIMSLEAYKVTFDNVSISCPVPFGAHEATFVEEGKIRQYTCKDTCGKVKYTLQSGSMQLSGQTHTSKWTIDGSQPTCHTCPVGATCESGIKSLPNYWGYKNEKNFVTMIRCPDGFCCKDNKTCSGIESCNKRRMGTLCGTCKNNYTESLFSQQCVSNNRCQFGVVLVLYSMCVLGYGGILVGMTVIKNNLLHFIKRLYQCCKDELGNKNKNVPIENKESKEEINQEETQENSDHSDNFVVSKGGSETSHTNIQIVNIDKEPNSGLQDVPKKEDSGMKYMQILFYYVQDASLFKIQLPSENQRGESFIVKVLQFSPDIVTTIYTDVTDLCFVEGSTAVTKVAFKSFFGPSVLVFLFLIYILQKVLSIIVKKNSKFWKLLRGYLVQAFLMTILLSYQKIVTGVFTLVQCVAVHDQKVLFIQGEIECYTWWQVIIKIFICLNVIPVFFVLSHCPFYVKDNTMSVRMFVLVCLFPLPALIWNLVLFKVSAKGIKESETEIELRNRCADKDSNIESESGENETHHISHCTLSKESGYKADTDKVSGCEHEIVHTLLRHYKSLTVCGIRFTWLGVHKLFRVALVACATYIANPVIKLSAMTGMLLCLTLMNSLIRPYKEKRANFTATCSYVLNICIAFINLIKAGLALYDCKNNCSFKTTSVKYLGVAENVFLVYVPAAAVLLWATTTALNQCVNKANKVEKKEEKVESDAESI